MYLYLKSVVLIANPACFTPWTFKQGEGLGVEEFKVWAFRV